MKIVLAPDSFKGSLTAVEAAEQMEHGLRRVRKDIQILSLPVADGGEGTIAAFYYALGGTICSVKVTGPAGLKTEARYLVLPDGTGILEMAEASGLTLLTAEQQNPLVTTTYGTGELLLAMLDAGCRKILVGLGGSATNDGGAGMVQALGVRLLDEQGRDLGYGGGELERLCRIDCSAIDSRLRECQIDLACDVSNPLCGEHGASFVYGPQKGADQAAAARLDKALFHYAELIAEQVGIQVANLPGAGAAGGLAAGFTAFCHAVIRPGIDTILDTIQFDRQVRDADLVFTGEGRTDRQSAYGKVPFGVARRVKAICPDTPVIVLSGTLGEGASELYSAGVDGMSSILQEIVSLPEAMSRAGELLQNAAERTFRLLLTGGRLKSDISACQ